jgi:antitoxin MazE
MSERARGLKLKVVAIGNSRGVRLPKTLLDRYAIKDEVILEEHENGLLLRNPGDKRLSWEETAREMAREHEDWTEFDAAAGDGIDPNERW